jgi:Plasmid pRiA4b ORF-3-like protein
MPSYKFRVLLDTENSQEIFRDIIISSNENFEIFYRAIITAFEFSGQELASFYVSNETWDRGHEIALMDMELSESLNAPSIMKDSILADMVSGEGQRFVLVYDFLRMWCFMTELVETIPETYDNPQLELSVGDSPDELSKEIDLGSDLNMDAPMDLGNEIDDIFSDSSGDDEFEDFENIDDIDI